MCSMKGNLWMLLKIGDIWGLSPSETILVNDRSPSEILLNSDRQQACSSGEEQDEGLSLTQALGKYLGLTSPSDPSYLAGLLWELESGS